MLFLLAILVATVSASGCAGLASSPANPPVTQGAAQLTVTPNSVSLNSTVGTAGSTQSVTATNSGTAALSVSQVNVVGEGFALYGLTPPPFSLSPGQSKNFTVMFGAASAGTVNGTLTIMTNASTSPVVVPLTGTGAAGGSTPAVTSVTIAPPSSTASTGATAQFSASVQGSAADKSVIWKAALGTISSTGRYTAPVSAGSDTVTATSNADSTKSASAAVTVTGATLVVNSVTISPSPASTLTGGTIQFTGTVTGTVTNKSVTWSAAHGTITTAGLYTPPAAAGSDTVTATSAADTTKSAASTVTVSTPVVNAVTVSPNSSSLAIGATHTFTATVAGNVTDTFVNNSQSSDDPRGSMPGPPSPYIAGNIGPHQSNAAGDQTAMTSQGSEAGDTGGVVPSSWFRSSPLAAEAFPITADPVGNLDSVLLSTVGNSRMLDCDGNWVNRRDSIDTRIIAQYQNKLAGGYFATADSTHSIPSIAAGTPCTESLHDGIPDQWKIDQGLRTTDPNLHKAIAPNGYTYLENYMNGPVGSASLEPNTKAWHWANTRPGAVPPNADAEKRARIQGAPSADVPATILPAACAAEGKSSSARTGRGDF